MKSEARMVPVDKDGNKLIRVKIGKRFEWRLDSDWTKQAELGYMKLQPRGKAK